MKTSIKNFLLFSLFLLFFSGMVYKRGYRVGDKVKDFALKNVYEKKVSLSDFKETKGFIIIFDCNTCPYSKAYNKRIKELHATYAPKGFPVIAINSNDPSVSPGDSFEKMQAYAKSKKYDFSYLYDADQQVARAYGATNTPHVYVLTKQKEELIVAYIGAIDDSPKKASSVTKRYVEDAVDALLQNNQVPMTNTKAIGCTIKWKRS